MRRRTHRRKKGGAELGSGSFGTVHYPPLSCANPADNITAPNYVTKATVIRDPNKDAPEFRIANIIRKKFSKKFIDDNLILVEKQCKIDPVIGQSMVSGIENRPGRIRTHPNILLWMKKVNGGTLYDIDDKLQDNVHDESSLQEFLTSMHVNTFEEFITILSNELDKIINVNIKLHKAGIYHNDLYSETKGIWYNVMYELKDKGFVLKIIDFGQGQTTEDILNEDGLSTKKEIDEYYEEEEMQQMRDFKEYFIKEEIYDIYRTATGREPPAIPAVNKAKCTNRGCTVMGGKRKTRRRNHL